MPRIRIWRLEYLACDSQIGVDKWNMVMSEIPDLESEHHS